MSHEWKKFMKMTNSSGQEHLGPATFPQLIQDGMATLTASLMQNPRFTPKWYPLGKVTMYSPGFCTIFTSGIPCILNQSGCGRKVLCRRMLAQVLTRGWPWTLTNDFMAFSNSWTYQSGTEYLQRDSTCHYSFFAERLLTKQKKDRNRLRHLRRCKMRESKTNNQQQATSNNKNNEEYT